MITLGQTLIEVQIHRLLKDRFYHLHPHAEGCNDAVEYTHTGCDDSILNITTKIPDK